MHQRIEHPRVVEHSNALNALPTNMHGKRLCPVPPHPRERHEHQRRYIASCVRRNLPDTYSIESRIAQAAFE